ncbi:MAG: sulfatase [Kiritimatiellales bacterium]
MNRKTLLFSAAALPALLSAQKMPVNIVLMVSDDHGREALGCYGNPVIKTPHLDALAAAGTRFTQAFCTSASSAASRSAILTGLHNHANGTYGHVHSFHHFSCFGETKTLPAMLQEAGYRTGRTGKMHYAPVDLFPFDELNPDEGEYGRDDLRMSEACREFISRPDPFFLYWCSWNPHRGGGSLESHPLQPNRFGNPDASFPGDTEQLYLDEEILVPAFLSNTPETRAELAQYYQSISRLDRGVGRLMQVLKEAGKYDNTLIIYISDNGSAFPGSKTTLYEPGMKLPCIVKAPHQQELGTTADMLITWTDITPFILDFAGVDVGEQKFHGQSFRYIFETDSPEIQRDEIYASHTFHELTNYYPMRVIRSHKYKFIYNIAWELTYPSSVDLWQSITWQSAIRDRKTHLGARTIEAYLHRPEFELYDLENDPDEINNLAGLPECAELLNSFIEKIKIFQQETSDPWAHKWIYE